jgi:hypothetical protein
MMIPRRSSAAVCGSLRIPRSSMISSGTVAISLAAFQVSTDGRF